GIAIPGRVRQVDVLPTAQGHAVEEQPIQADQEEQSLADSALTKLSESRHEKTQETGQRGIPVRWPLITRIWHEHRFQMEEPTIQNAARSRDKPCEPSTGTLFPYSSGAGLLGPTHPEEQLSDQGRQQQCQTAPAQAAA